MNMKLRELKMIQDAVGESNMFVVGVCLTVTVPMPAYDELMTLGQECVYMPIVESSADSKFVIIDLQMILDDELSIDFSREKMIVWLQQYLSPSIANVAPNVDYLYVTGSE